MARVDPQHSDHHDGLQVGSISSSESSAVLTEGCAATVLCKAVSLPMLPFFRSDEPREVPQLRHITSCGGVTPNSHRMMTLRDEIPLPNLKFGWNANLTMATTPMMLQDDLQPLPSSRIPHTRRMSLLEEGDEAFFAGKKFFYVGNPSPLPTLPKGEQRPTRASGA